MSTLAPGDIRARKRPYLILGLALARLLCGLCLAYPLAALVGTSGVGLRAEGDRALFESGGYLLLEVARLQGPALGNAARGLLPLLGLGLVIGVAGGSLLLVALSNTGDKRASSLSGRALSRLPTLLLISVLVGLAQAALLLFASIVAEGVPESMTRPVAATAGQLGIWLVAASIAGALGGLGDVAKAASVRAEAGLALSLDQARRALFRRPILACFGWLPYAALLLVAFGIGAEIAELIDVSRPGGGRVALVFVVHQLVIVASVALRAGWYAKALRFVASVP